MPAPSVWDERVRVCGIPSRLPGSPPGLPSGVLECGAGYVSGTRATGVCRSHSFLLLARTPWSWLRELMASLVKTLCRWYSMVRRLMKSWAAISGLDRPPPASRAIWASRAVSREGHWWRACGLARGWPSAHARLVPRTRQRPWRRTSRARCAVAPRASSSSPTRRRANRCDRSRDRSRSRFRGGPAMTLVRQHTACNRWHAGVPTRDPTDANMPA